MKVSIQGGPLDGGSIDTGEDPPLSDICTYFSEEPRLAHYRYENGLYSFVQTFGEDELKRANQ